MATEITATSQDITGDFDLVVRGNPSAKPAILQKALGAAGVDFITCKVLGSQGHHFVKNTGTNAYKIAEAVAGVTVEFNQ